MDLDFIELYEDSDALPKRPRVMAARVTLESDRSFAEYETPWRTSQVAPCEQCRCGLEPDAAGRLVQYPSQRTVALRFTRRWRGWAFAWSPCFGSRRPARVPPSNSRRPGMVRLDPRWQQAARRFIEMGFSHILEGTDHLLFLLCLVIPFRRLRALIPVVTSFTVAHSITLIASAYNLGPDALWFPPLIETLIAISIVYMALENIVGGSTTQRRWMMSFGFGLVHGFGFSFALRQSLQFAGSHLLASLLSFNIGVELGQLLVLVLLVPLLELLFRAVVAERMGRSFSALVATRDGTGCWSVGTV